MAAHPAPSVPASSPSLEDLMDAAPERCMVVERVVRAPRALVWQTWTDDAHLDKWWGPNGFLNETHSFDFRLGGRWRYTMHAEDGTDFPNWIEYLDIVAEERMVYAHGAEDDEPAWFFGVVTFEDAQGGTKVTMRSVFPSAAMREEVVNKYKADRGGHETLACLAGYLMGVAQDPRPMTLSRLVYAPVDKVWTAWSTESGLRSWWGPRDMTLPGCEIDFRVGGAYRMTMRGADGTEYPFHGTYKDIVKNERIVFDADIGAGEPILTTVTFIPEGDRTRLVVNQTVPRDKNAAAGQQVGWNGSLAKLAEMVES